MMCRLRIWFTGVKLLDLSWRSVILKYYTFFSDQKLFSAPQNELSGSLWCSQCFIIFTIYNLHYRINIYIIILFWESTFVFHIYILMPQIDIRLVQGILGLFTYLHITVIYFFTMPNICVQEFYSIILLLVIQS